MKSSEIKATARKVINELAEPIVQRRRKAKVGGDRRGERNRDKEVLEIVRQLTEDGLARLQQAAHGRQGDRALADFTLKPFLDRPNAMWALALNFKSHIAETGLKTSSEFPHLFMRTAASYVGGRFQASCRLDG